jgi:hypothetical protein
MNAARVRAHLRHAHDQAIARNDARMFAKPNVRDCDEDEPRELHAVATAPPAASPAPLPSFDELADLARTGQRIVVEIQDGDARGVIVGYVAALHRFNIVIETCGRTKALPLSKVTRIDVVARTDASTAKESKP